MQTGVKFRIIEHSIEHSSVGRRLICMISPEKNFSFIKKSLTR